MLFKEIIVVYSENHDKPINTKRSITECQSRWFILLPLGLKGLMSRLIRQFGPDPCLWELPFQMWILNSTRTFVNSYGEEITNLRRKLQQTDNLQEQGAQCGQHLTLLQRCTTFWSRRTFKNSVRTSKRTQYFTITKINWLMLFKL
jgi:hypothetical protein